MAKSALLLGAPKFGLFDTSPACPVFGLEENNLFSDYGGTRVFSWTQIQTENLANFKAEKLLKAEGRKEIPKPFAIINLNPKAR